MPRYDKCVMKRKLLSLCLLRLSSFVISSLAYEYTPQEVATVVGNSLVKLDSVFINWEGGFTYGGAVTGDGLFQAAQIVDPKVASDWMSALSFYLDRYSSHSSTTTIACDAHQPYGPSNVTRSCGWALANNQSLKWDSWELSTVGDSLGLFPIVYLDRYLYHNGSLQDALVALEAVEKYVFPYHYHLADGTVSRTGGCCAPPPPPSSPNQAPFLWADDQFMGSALIARLSTVRQLASLATRRRWIDHITSMQLHFASYLLDEQDGLSAHGAFVDSNGSILHSCCKWGRANGWGALSRIEILKAIDAEFPHHPLRSRLLRDFESFMQSMIKYQSEDDGRWHQVVNETSTYLETSVTAMMITALANSITKGWLSAEKYSDSLEKAWRGLVKNSINMTDGTVNFVCMGTGIQSNLTGYAERGHNYLDSAPGGVGSVLMACNAMHNYVASKSKSSLTIN